MPSAMRVRSITRPIGTTTGAAMRTTLPMMPPRMRSGIVVSRTGREPAEHARHAHRHEAHRNCPAINVANVAAGRSQPSTSAARTGRHGGQARAG